MQRARKCRSEFGTMGATREKWSEWREYAKSGDMCSLGAQVLRLTTQPDTVWPHQTHLSFWH